MRYSVISFDLDGTLVDTGAEIATAVNRTLAEFGLPPQPEATIFGFIGAGTRTTLQRTLDHLCERDGICVNERCRAAMGPRLDAHYGDLAGTIAQPYPGALAALHALRLGGVRLACLTNKEHAHALKVLQGTGLLAAFDFVAGGDRLPHAKPHPQALQHVLDALGGEAGRAAHVGDSATDVEAARAAGAEAWFVPWGYTGGRRDAGREAHRHFTGLPEVADFVLAANRAQGCRVAA
ncbi:MAG: HAD-IA family hydrolase [Burkholderiaceae bacterium]|nr:HAD-IA family hydrolase [Burkholderiaceae bacterium]